MYCSFYTPPTVHLIYRQGIVKVDFDIQTVAIIVVIAIVAFGFRKLIIAENKKNEPDAPVLRDSDTRPGDQGRKTKRETS